MSNQTWVALCLFIPHSCLVILVYCSRFLVFTLHWRNDGFGVNDIQATRYGYFLEPPFFWAFWGASVAERHNAVRRRWRRWDVPFLGIWPRQGEKSIINAQNGLFGMIYLKPLTVRTVPFLRILGCDSSETSSGRCNENRRFAIQWYDALWPRS